MPMLIMSEKDLESVRKSASDEAAQVEDLRALLALLEKRTRQARRYKELLKLADQALTRIFSLNCEDRAAVEQRIRASTRLQVEMESDGL